MNRLARACTALFASAALLAGGGALAQEAPAPAAAAARVIGFDQAIEIALAQNDDLRQARNNAALGALDVAGPVVGFEVFLDALPPEKRKSLAKAPLAQSDLLPVRRDFAFVLDGRVNAGDVVKAALGADKALIAAVSVFDVFEGGALAAEGKKSVAIEVTLQPVSGTLTDKDIEAISQAVIANVKKATGGEIRS